MKQKDIEMEKINSYLETYNSLAEFYIGERDNLIHEVLLNNYKYISPEEENCLLRMAIYEEDMHKLEAAISASLPLEVMPGEEEVYLQRFYDYHNVPRNFDIILQKFCERDYVYSRKLK